MTAPIAGLRARLVHEGEYWTIGLEDEELRVRHSKGIRYLAELLARPYEDIPALALISAHTATPVPTDTAAQAGLCPGLGSDLGPVLDTRARHAYRRRLEQLQVEIQQAHRFDDSTRAEQARLEAEMIRGQLRAATGLRGRDRRAGSPAERARLNATRAIRSAIERIAAHDPVLARHLSTAIHTGRSCGYFPPRPELIVWNVRTSRPHATRIRTVPTSKTAAKGDPAPKCPPSPAVRFQTRHHTPWRTRTGTSTLALAA